MAESEIRLTSFTLSNPATSPTNADTLVFLASFPLLRGSSG